MTNSTGGEVSGGVAEVVLGVDTHLYAHVVVALDLLGRRLGEKAVPRTARGYDGLLRWAAGLGAVVAAGVEGTGGYGAGLARHLRSAGIAVEEVERPKRRQRSSRRDGKSDSRDAEAAARVVLAGETAGAQGRGRPRRDGPRAPGGPPLGGESQGAGGQPAPGPAGNGA